MPGWGIYGSSLADSIASSLLPHLTYRLPPSCEPLAAAALIKTSPGGHTHTFTTTVSTDPRYIQLTMAAPLIALIAVLPTSEYCPIIGRSRLGHLADLTVYAAPLERRIQPPGDLYGPTGKPNFWDVQQSKPTSRHGARTRG